MRASSLQACVFVQTPSSKVFVFDGYGNPIDIQTDSLSDREAAAFMAMQDAFNLSIQRNGSFSYQNHICPWDWSTNNAVMAQNGLFTFPTAIITADYPDGSQKQYVLGKEFIDKLTGGIWTAEKLYPYIKILLTGVTPKQSDTTFLCKLAPPLCSLAGWMWFALAAGTTIKAINSKGVKKIAWGAGSALLWNEWIGRGGLSQIGKKKRIGAIFNEVPELYECTDGTYSSATTSRACSRHGGRKSNTPIKFGGGGGSDLLNIQDVPLNQIYINRELFQGREKAYSKRSVDNIVQDAKEGRFAWENLDPITLWKDPTGKLFLLSGHSRHKAFEVLASEGVRVEGKGFDRIPAKIRTGSLATAQRMALESNTLSTKETDIERAAYYRRLRQDGEAEKNIVLQGRKNEGRNWANIYAFTFLNPSGRTWAMLRQFSEGEDQSATMAKNMAKWIGTARREFPGLTNEHEAELYAWLFEQKGYGSGAGQVSNERDFLEKVAMFVAKNTFFDEFDQSKPLNILQAQYKSPVEMQFESQIQEQNQSIADMDRKIKAKIKELTNGGASKSLVAEVLAPMEASLRSMRLELARLLQKKQEVAQYARNEATLFGHRRRRVSSVGKTPQYI